MTRRGLAAFLLTIGTVLICAGGAGSQESQPAPASPGERVPFDFLPSAGGLGAAEGFGSAADGDIRLSGTLNVEQDGRDGVLEIKAWMDDDWHVYALTQEGGPGPSKISIGPADRIVTTGPFRARPEPEERRVEVFKVPLREHYGEVVWTVPVRLADGVDAQTVALDVRFDGTLCHDESGCIPVSNKPVPVKFGGFYVPPKAPTPPAVPSTPATPAARETTAPPAVYRADRSHAEVSGYVEPATVQPGGALKLAITVACDDQWHVYAYEPRDPELIAKPALLALDSPAWPAGPVMASAEPHEEVMIPGDPAVRYHDGTVTWTTEIQVPADAPPGPLELQGLFGYQTCTARGCDPPTAARFTAELAVGPSAEPSRRPLTFAAARYSQAAELAAQQHPAAAETPLTGTPLTGTPPTPPAGTGLDLSQLQVQTSEYPLAVVLVFALIGGLILNVMPCVLPVIGLKIMSFVQQAGESRTRVFALNLWYSLGLMSVFWLLATMTAVFNLGWGELFTFDEFRIPLAAVVFVMGLSLLGVWEIPIPGFVSGGKADEMAQREGAVGAFSKGVLTTVMGTPCIAPFLGVATAWCGGKPALQVYAVFTLMGLGMASPYLVIGLNPKLMRFIPKPGGWMETFKQLMGFALLGTVVFIFTFIGWVMVLPSLALLIGLWASCWWIGRTPITAEFQAKLRAYLSATAFAILVGLLSFTGQWGPVYGLKGMMEARLNADFASRLDAELRKLGTPATDADPGRSIAGTGPSAPQAATGTDGHEFELPWQPFSEARLRELTAQQKTVMVDFTANWCLTCKWLEATVLNTREVRRLVDENGVIPLVADWTDRNEEIAGMLTALGSKQVPVIAIFPAGRPNEPIVLRDGYSQGTLLEKLRQAGPSASATPAPGAPAVVTEARS